MSATITVQDVVKNQANLFTQFFCAFRECTPPVQEVVVEMSEIVHSPEATADEKDHALDVIISALFPGLMDDIAGSDLTLRGSEKFRAEGQRIKNQQAAFSDNVRRLMGERDVTQEKLAEMTGVSQPAISNILNRNCRPQQRTIRRFAEAFGVDPKALWPAIEDMSDSVPEAVPVEAVGIIHSA